MRNHRREAGRSALLEIDEPILGARVGWIAGYEAERGILVDFEGNQRGPLPARSTVSLDARAVQASAAARQQVVLLFEAGDPSQPLLVGLVQSVSSTPLLDELLASPLPEPEPEPSLPVEARVDGQRVVLEGQDEILLRCGKASITLQRNGQVVIRGARVETTAAGVHRIKGGSVQIN